MDASSKFNSQETDPRATVEPKAKAIVEAVEAEMTAPLVKRDREDPERLN